MGQTTNKRYWEINPVIEKYPKARYYYVLGGRGTGKTYPVVKKAIQDAIDGKGVFAYVRRYKEAITRKNMADILSPHNEWLAEYTKGQWNRVIFWQGRIWLERWEEDPETHNWEKAYYRRQ